MKTISLAKETSRVWVFAANRLLTDVEVQSIQPLALQFCSEWTAHKVALSASADVLYNNFLVINVDEEAHGASGCSIDVMHGFIRSLEKLFNVNFFDRLRVIYPDKGKVENCSLSEFEKRFAKGEVDFQTRIFNTLVSNGKELSEKFMIPVQDSWLAGRLRK